MAMSQSVSEAADYQRRQQLAQQHSLVSDHFSLQNIYTFLYNTERRKDGQRREIERKKLRNKKLGQQDGSVSDYLNSVL